MSLSKLVPLIDENTLLSDVDVGQLKLIYAEFERDFISNPLVISGKAVKVSMRNSKIPGLTEFPETFGHIITREILNNRDRYYESNRANRIHWIKPILEDGGSTKDILHFKWKDDSSKCRDHYWLFSKDFMVVTQDIGKDMMIITAFCVDNDKKLTYYERFKEFQDGKSGC